MRQVIDAMPLPRQAQLDPCQGRDQVSIYQPASYTIPSNYSRKVVYIQPLTIDLAGKLRAYRLAVLLIVLELIFLFFEAPTEFHACLLLFFLTDIEPDL